LPHGTPLPRPLLPVPLGLKNSLPDLEIEARLR